eukprot:TRINITY_DN4109_c0_g1_i1.p1 TRINITY_DN4109_c0_g1~~TRINITY_DN4109_c0_g1_i1.p1  ORF type:complete len:222 (-),score=73.19 TRINITY_DN4109_c0_g1_i1:97-762(-)
MNAKGKGKGAPKGKVGGAAPGKVASPAKGAVKKTAGAAKAAAPISPADTEAAAPKRTRAAPKKTSGGSGPRRALPVATQQVPRGSEHEIFSLWDIEGDDTIDVSVVGDVLRACGQAPTEADIEEIINEYSSLGAIDWSTFQQIMAKGAKSGQDLEQDVTQLYYVFDQKDNGICLTAEVETAFMSIGEKLTDHEVDDLVQYADPNRTGFFNFADFVKVQLNK